MISLLISAVTLLIFIDFTYCKPIDSSHTIQACGKELADLLQEACANGYNGYGIVENAEYSYRGRRKRGITQECCAQACTRNDLQEYCQNGAPKIDTFVSKTPTDCIKAYNIDSNDFTKTYNSKLDKLKNDKIPNEIVESKESSYPRVKPTTDRIIEHTNLNSKGKVVTQSIYFLRQKPSFFVTMNDSSKQ